MLRKGYISRPQPFLGRFGSQSRPRWKCAFAAQESSDTHEAKPITAADAAFGPRGLVLAGFQEDQVRSAAAWMQEMEPDFRICCLSDDMLAQPLCKAIGEEVAKGKALRSQGWSRTKALMPRICIFSGLSGEEQLALAENWHAYAGSPAPIFAAVVPRTWDKTLRDVLQAIVDSQAQYDATDERLDPNSLLQSLDREALQAAIQAKLAQVDSDKGVENEGSSRPGGEP